MCVGIVGAVVVAGGVSGCRSRRVWYQQQAGPILWIKNDSGSPARVSVGEARRDPTRPGGVTGLKFAKPVTVQRGTTQAWTIDTRIPAAERVVRFKVETVGASWEEPLVSWFEVVGPMPQKVVSLERPQNGAFTVRTQDGDVRPVPREFWVEPDGADGAKAADPAPGQ